MPKIIEMTKLTVMVPEESVGEVQNAILRMGYEVKAELVELPVNVNGKPIPAIRTYQQKKKKNGPDKVAMEFYDAVPIGTEFTTGEMEKFMVEQGRPKSALYPALNKLKGRK
jgi:hypothetical protein